MKRVKVDKIRADIAHCERQRDSAMLQAEQWQEMIYEHENKLPESEKL